MVAVTAPILALSVTTTSSAPRPPSTGCWLIIGARTHLRLSPASMGLASIGHFAFFHERFRDTYAADRAGLAHAGSGAATGDSHTV